MAPPNVKIKHLIRSTSGNSKLDECAHFHYENVELGPVKIVLCDRQCNTNKLSMQSSTANKENEVDYFCFLVLVISNGRKWVVRRSYKDFVFLDTQLHRCVYDRKYSLLRELSCNVNQEVLDDEEAEVRVRALLSEYLERFSQLAGSLITCGPVLNWLELDNRGNRLIVTDEVAINTPAVAAAYVVMRYTAQAADEISFDVGDMISVIDMPPPEESTWWRGKRGFEVGFFPSECVEVIGDKVPHGFKISNASTKPVFRKHGKLIAFFRSFLLSRPSRRKLKQSGILKERVFGCDLAEHLLNTGREIPLVLKCCSEFIEEYGVVDGIYRLSGVSSNIQRLRNAFDEDCATNLGDPTIAQDVHSVASLLKMYFRELPNPLLTYQLYDKFVCAVQSHEDVRLLRIRDVVQQLPPPHYRTLQYLLNHLARVASYGHQTGMTPKNIAIVWAPNLLRSRDVENGGVGALHVVGVQAVLTEYLIRYCDLIFDEKMPLFSSSDQEDGVPLRARPKSLAISTPTKLLSLEEARARALSTHLPLEQQKYIDVGGGPDNLPSKYHTVIDLPLGKQSCPKLKKSPSGWKSFFSRGWYSGSTRDKGRAGGRNSRKASTGSLPHTSVHMQENESSSVSSQYRRKKLRTVKSAESLVHCSKESASIANKGDNSGSHHSSPDTSMDSSYSFDVYSPHSKSPSLQKHTRSSSHESYFDNNVDIISEPAAEEEDEEHSLFYYVNEEMQKLRESATWHIDSEVFESPVSSSIKQDDVKDCMDLNLAATNQSSPTGVDKMGRKQKLETEDDFSNAKVQRLCSPRNEFDKVNICDRSEMVANYDNTSEGDLSLSDVTICDFNFSTSPSAEGRSFWLPRSDQSVFCKLSGNHNDGYKLDPFSFYDSKRASCISSSDTEADYGNRTVVERYGNAETVLVEVHATQDSSSEGDRESVILPSLEQNKLEGKSNDAVFGHEEEIAHETHDSSSVHLDAPELLNNEISDTVLLPLSEILSDISNISNDLYSQEDSNQLEIVNISDCKAVEDADVKEDSDILPSKLSDTDESSGSDDIQTTVETAVQFPINEKFSDLVKEKSSSSSSEEEEDFRNVVLRSKDRGTKLEQERQKLKLHLTKHDERNPSIDNEDVDISDSGSSFNRSYYVKSPPSPIYPPKNNQVHDIYALKAKIENIPLPKKRILSIPSPSSPVEEVRKKFELKASISQNQKENVRTELKPVSLFKDSPSKLCAKQKDVFESPVFVPTHKDTTDNSKRMSDVIFSAKNENLSNKRHSEPVTIGLDSAAVREASISKAVVRTDIRNSALVESPDNSCSKARLSQPSLFTQLKIRKLQSLQGNTAASAKEVDPWSDPILDLQEEYHPVIFYSEPKKTSDSISETEIDIPCKSINEESIAADVEYAKDVSEVSFSEDAEPIVQSINEDVFKDKTKFTNEIIEKQTDENVETLLDSSDVKDNEEKEMKFLEEVETETVKRERINRIKEERRAQLREKLKTESFRLEAEEKEKVTNKFRLRKDYCRLSLEETGDHRKEKSSECESFVNKTSDSVDSDSEHTSGSVLTNQNKRNCDLKMSLTDDLFEEQRLRDVESSLTSPTKDSSASLKNNSDQHLFSPVSNLSKRVPESRLHRRSGTPSDIRDRVAMFERSKDTKDSCRLGPNGKFPQKQGTSTLTPSFVR